MSKSNPGPEKWLLLPIVWRILSTRAGIRKIAASERGSHLTRGEVHCKEARCKQDCGFGRRSAGGRSTIDAPCHAKGRLTVTYHVVEPVMLDLLFKHVIGETLDAHIAKASSLNDPAEGSSKDCSNQALQSCLFRLLLGVKRVSKWRR